MAFLASMNVVALWSGAGPRDAFHLASALIALPAVAFSGQPFFRSAWASLRSRRLGMDAPISLALVLATAVSLLEALNGGCHACFAATAMLAFVLLGGRTLDHPTRAAARSAARELAALEMPRALRLAGGTREMAAVADLRPGDLVLVAPGARVPADGIVVEGESPPPRPPRRGASRGRGEAEGPLTVRVTAAGRDSPLARRCSTPSSAAPTGSA